MTFLPRRWFRRTPAPEPTGEQRREAELLRLRDAPRYAALRTGLLGAPLTLVDGRSFYYSYREIFEREIYRFETANPSPFIIDGGANIGLSVIYFKRTFPRSRILAFEPDPAVFRALEENIAAFGCRDDVRLVNKALWSADAEMAFAPEGADVGRLAREGEPGSVRTILVPAERLLGHLAAQRVDMLKLDIEGAETDVLVDAAAALGNVENLFVEYHSFPGKEQRLPDLLSVLRAAGFRTQIQTQFCAPQPLVRRENHLGMDLQLNIFAYRENGGGGGKGTDE